MGKLVLKSKLSIIQDVGLTVFELTMSDFYIDNILYLMWVFFCLERFVISLDS